MNCAGCAANATRALARTPGVEEATVDFATARATVVVRGIDDEAIAAAIRGAGFIPESAERVGAAPEGSLEALFAAQQQAQTARALREVRWRRGAIVGLGVWMPLETVHWLSASGHSGSHGPAWWPWVAFAGATLALIVAGGAFLSSAWRAARHRASNMDTLVSLGALAAYGLSSWNLLAMVRDPAATPGPMYFAEAAALFGIVSLGHWIETRGSARATRDIESLLTLQPREAEVIEASGSTRSVAMAAVRPGMLVRVRPGGVVPVDGVVRHGSAAVDESALTGEPLPVTRGIGHGVRAGSLAVDGALDIEVTACGMSSTLAQVARLVQEAISTQAPIQRHADRVCRWFVPTVLIIAAGTFAAWASRGPVEVAIINAVTVLVISCPCALGIATPLAMAVGVSHASRRGILVRRVRALESAARATTVIFDKTGTLTLGRPTFARMSIVNAAWDESSALAFAAAAESRSEHPVGKAIVAEAARRRLQTPRAESFAVQPGVGVSAQVDGHELHVRRDEESSARLEVDGETIARFWVTDEPRSEARDAVAALAAQGLRVAMLTGDRRESARAIAARVGIAEGDLFAQATPSEKVDVVKRLGGVQVIMVGDGINDAAALAAAGAGVSMGSATALAEASADATLLQDDPRAMADFVDLSRRTLACVRQNLVLAFLYNGAAIPLAALGLLAEHGPILAAAAMGLSDICVVGNALRLRWSLARSRGARGSGTPSQA